MVQVLDDRFQEVISAERGNLVILSETLEAGAYIVRCSASGTDSGRYSLSVFAADVPQINVAATPSQRDRE